MLILSTFDCYSYYFFEICKFDIQTMSNWDAKKEFQATDIPDSLYLEGICVQVNV